MHRASLSWPTFLVRSSLAGVVAALPLALQGCAAFTCFEGDPGCESASEISTGGGVTGTGGTGGGVTGTGAGGGAPCGSDCWGGECVGGECQPVLVALGGDLSAGRIAAARNFVYAVVTAANGNLHILKIDFKNVTGPDGVLLQGNHTLLDTLITAGGAASAFIAAKGEETYLSPQTAKGLHHCTFTGTAHCTPVGDPGTLYHGLTLGNATDLPSDTLYVVRGDAQAFGVTQFLPVDPYTPAGIPPSPPDPSPSSADGAHAIAVGPDGRLAWTLYGDAGCVTVGKEGNGADTKCTSKCLAPMPVAFATGVAIDDDSNVFYVAVDSTDTKRYALYRANATDGTGCEYEAATLYRDLELTSLSQGVAVSGDSVYVVAKAPSGAGETGQSVLRCPRKGEASGCTEVVKLEMSIPGGSLSVAATPDGVFFASDTQIGWKHL